MYDKTIMEFGFCLGKCNRHPVSAEYSCFDLDYSGCHKKLIQLLFIIKSLVPVGHQETSHVREGER